MLPQHASALIILFSPSASRFSGVSQTPRSAGGTVAFTGCRALAYVHQLLLRVVLSAAALPVAVGLVNGLQLLLAVLAIRLGLQVQRAAVAALRRAHIRGGEGASLVHG